MKFREPADGEEANTKYFKDFNHQIHEQFKNLNENLAV